MKILLIGEYSRLHNSLKEGLQALGHEVLLVGDGDAFKNYPVDVNINPTISSKYLPSILRTLFLKLFKIDIVDYERAYKFKKVLPKLKGFDIVQFINEDVLGIHPKLQFKLLDQLFKQNGKSFLLCCGQDHVSIAYALKGKVKYSILTPYLNHPNLKKRYGYSLKYLSSPYQKLHLFLKKHIEGVIASDIDYHLPYQQQDNYLGLIPNPINVDKIDYMPMEFSGKIKIFHGINEKSAIKKGNHFFESALAIIEQNYADKIEVLTVKSMPYQEYIKRYDECHILLDQVYAYDQGYNALEAMAKGKVVFSGAEQEWLDYYNVAEDSIVINALPDAEAIAKKLEWLILNPSELVKISKNARSFIEKEHHYINCAKCYLKVYQK